MSSTVAIVGRADWVVVGRDEKMATYGIKVKIVESMDTTGRQKWLYEVVILCVDDDDRRREKPTTGGGVEIDDILGFKIQSSFFSF